MLGTIDQKSKARSRDAKSRKHGKNPCTDIDINIQFGDGYSSGPAHDAQQ